MLDENLPTFRLKPSSDSPLASILYLTQNGSDPAPEYLLRRPDPALPASHSRYAIALCDPYNAGVVYGEVMMEPEWPQPTLSAAEIRAHAQAGAPPAPATALVPDTFMVQLYNPDQTVAIKMVPGTWGKSDSWEFELPVETFCTPTTSLLDREQQNTSPAAAGLIPRIMFRWKKDGLLSKDMTCYVSGKRLGARKNKEPDITIALFKAARESTLTVYQPNLHRVEVEDRKGLELVLLLSSEVIKDLWLMPKADVFNVQGGGGQAVNGSKRKNSRPVGTGPPAGTAAVSGTLANIPASQLLPSSSPPAKNNTTTPATSSKPEIDAETRRLQAMLEREKREREKAERAEQKRIKKMIEEEEKERRRREAEVAKETERLRRVYGVQGQELPSDRPPLPPRILSPQQHQQAPPHPLHIPAAPLPPHPAQQQQLHPWGYSGSGIYPLPAPPPRPVSAGPGGRQQQQQQPGQQRPCVFNALNTPWRGSAGQQQQQQPPRPPQGRRGMSEEERRKVQKKRSSLW